MQSELSYHDPDYREKIESLKRNARQVYAPAPRLQRLALLALAIGTVGFVAGILYAPGRAWGALDASFLFWVGLSQGAIVVAAVFNTGWAKWGRVVQRILEPLGLFTIFSPFLFFLLWLGRSNIFSWIHQGERSRWLSSAGMFWRDEAVLVVMTGLSLWWLYRSLRPDIRMAAGGNAPADRFSRWMIRNWKGDQQEAEWTGVVLRNLGPAIIVGFCWGYGMLSVDLGLTLDSHVKSTMFPGIYWASEFLAPLALAGILVAGWRRSNAAIAELIPASILQDLGNMIWAFAIFRTWFDWSQYIIWWYGNLPDEAGYLMDRWRTIPWKFLAWGSLYFEFIIPFLAGFSRHVKRNPVTLAGLGGVVFLGILTRTFADVMPSIARPGPSDVGLIEVAISIGFVGAIALPYLWLLQRVPLFPVADPVFQEALETRGAPET